MPRARWANRLIVFAIVAVPIAAFFVLQTISARTRSGTLSDVWLLELPDGRPVLVALDGIPVGARLRGPGGQEVDSKLKLKWRLVAVDPRTGERLTRESVDAPLSLFAVTADALWFHDRADQGDPHPRDPSTLKRRSAPGGPLPDARPPPAQPVAAEVTREGRVLGPPALKGEERPDAAFLVDAWRRAPVEVDGELLRVQREVGQAREGLELARIAEDGTARWHRTLERQRTVHAAMRVGEDVVVVTGAAARDFAFSISLADGQVRWVHAF